VPLFPLDRAGGGATARPPLRSFRIAAASAGTRAKAVGHDEMLQPDGADLLNYALHGGV